MFVDEVLIRTEASDGEDESVRANEFGLKFIKVWCRLERKIKKSRGDIHVKELIRKMMVIIVKCQ